jgi:gamma-glutamylputrescine oxidase
MSALPRAMDTRDPRDSCAIASPDPFGRSWYHHQCGPSPARPGLDNELRCDVAIVGGGLFGLSTALHLAERGVDVALVEAGRIGDGASGRNGGLVLPGFAATNAELAAASDPETARALWRLTVDAVETVKALVADHAIACDLQAGVVTAAAAPGHARRLCRDAGDLRRDHGYADLETLSAAEVRALIGTDRHHGGLLDRRAAHLQPLAFTRGLASAAERAGARLYEASPALAVTGGDRPTVTTAAGRLVAREVVLAANVAIGDLAPGLAPGVVPLATYMIATEPMGAARAARLMPGRVAAYDTEVALNYFRLSADHRLLFGGGVTAGPRDRAWITRHLGRAMTGLFPQLADLRIEHAWGGRLDMTPNRVVRAGRDGTGCWFADGFSGHGLALSVRVGRAMADALTGAPADLALLGRVRHRDLPLARRLAPVALPARVAWERLRQAVRPDAFYSL